MYFSFPQLNYLLMYFIHGLAFFSLGLTMALKGSRLPDVAAFLTLAVVTAEDTILLLQQRQRTAY